MFAFPLLQVNAQDTVRIISNGHEILKVDNKTMHLSSAGKGTFIGLNAGSLTPNTDNWNTFVGYESGSQATFGISNAYFGAFTGTTNSNGSGNTFIGAVAGRENTGSNNTFVGTASGRLSGAGFHNNFFGANAGSNNAGGHNISIGHFAGQFGNGQNNIAIGRNSLPNVFSRNELIAIGDSTLFSNGQGATLFFQSIKNTAIGNKALKANTTGSNNSASGYETLKRNTSGANNTAFGATSLTNNTIGFGNTAVGSISLFSNLIGNYNTALGNEAGRFTKGKENTFIGAKTGVNNSNGNGNVFLGYAAGENSIGSNQLMIHNSNTPTPLLQGYFDSTKLVINGDLEVTGTINLPSIDVAQIDGILGNGYSAVLPDVVYNIAEIEISGITNLTDVLIVSTVGFEIDTFSTPLSGGNRLTELGFNSEYPLIFETDNQDMITDLDNWLSNPDRRFITLKIEDLSGVVIGHFNLFEYSIDSKEPGTDGRTRYTLKSDLPPDNNLTIELVNDFFGDLFSFDPATDKLVEILGIIIFRPEVTVDTVNRVITMEYGYLEGSGFFDWMETNAEGLVDRRALTIIETTDGTSATEISRKNYFEVVPFKFEIIYGFGLNTKIKARVQLFYTFEEDV